jgi:hypothetical protein
MARKDRKYFKFTNIRTGESTYYGCGLTIDEHMELERRVRKWMDNIIWK